MWLKTIGAASAKADSCNYFYFPKNTFVETVKLYYIETFGIVGAYFKVAEGTEQSFGDVSGVEKTYNFSQEKILLGYSGITFSDATSTHIQSLSLITFIRDSSQCYVGPEPVAEVAQTGTVVATVNDKTPLPV